MGPWGWGQMGVGGQIGEVGGLDRNRGQMGIRGADRSRGQMSGDGGRSRWEEGHEQRQRPIYDTTSLYGHLVPHSLSGIPSPIWYYISCLVSNPLSSTTSPIWFPMTLSGTPSKKGKPPRPDCFALNNINESPKWNSSLFDICVASHDTLCQWKQALFCVK